MRGALLRAYTWVVAHSLCPCAWNGPAWSRQLCGRIDAYCWRSGYWGGEQP